MASLAEKRVEHARGTRRRSTSRASAARGTAAARGAAVRRGRAARRGDARASGCPRASTSRPRCAQLQAEYAPRGVNLVRIAGKWTFRTANDLAWLLTRESTVDPAKLSRAAIETLAIIAYHQPVTRAEIEEIRGVVISKGTLDVLLETGWIRPRGRRKTPGRPLTFGTTEAFLSHFGLEALGDLPGLEELKGTGLFDGRLPAGFAFRCHRTIRPCATTRIRLSPAISNWRWRRPWSRKRRPTRGSTDVLIAARRASTDRPPLAMPAVSPLLLTTSRGLQRVSRPASRQWPIKYLRKRREKTVWRGRREVVFRAPDTLYDSEQKPTGIPFVRH